MKKYIIYLFTIFAFIGVCHITNIKAQEYKEPIIEEVQEAVADTASVKTIKKKNNKYYGYRDGKLMKNTFTLVDGSYYFFDENGAAITSKWKTINSKKYYFGSNGKAYTGAKKIGSYIYGFSNSGNLLKDYGYKKIDGKYYYFNKDGKSIKGFYKAGNYYRYFNGDGSVACATFKEIDGTTYYFTKSGIMCTSSWKNVRDEMGLEKSKYISCDENGAVREGFYEVEVNGETNLYYFDKDLTRGVKTGLCTIDDKIYYFKASGAAAKGLYKIGKYNYFFQEDGSAKRSKWVEVNNKRYYMASNGRSYVDCIKKVGQYTYYFTKSGYAHVGYKAFETETGTQYYYFNSKGRSREALLQIPGKEYSRYFNGDGSVATSEFKEYKGNLYFFTKAGVLCQDEWRNIKTDLGIEEAKYVATDPTTGIVKQGYTTVLRDGSIYTFYMDKDAQYGYRLGKQDCGDLGTYYFAVEKGNKGYLRSGFISDADTKSLYYCDPQTFKMQKEGRYQIEGTDAYFNIESDGNINVDSELLDTDDNVTKLIKICFSQMFKDYGHLSIGHLNLLSLDEIEGYSCSGYVLRMINEVFWGLDILGENHDIGYEMHLKSKEDDRYIVYSPTYDIDNLEVGDLIFINKDDCYESVDDRGEPMIIDLDGDGVCDREHSYFMGEDGASVNLHVHHVGIYLGNNLYINSMPGKGVIISELPKKTSTEYISGYGHIAYDHIEIPE